MVWLLVYKLGMTSPTPTPLLIGLPGAGKSTTGALVALALGLEILSTDTLFRQLRAIPYTPSPAAKDPSEVMHRFVERAVSRWPHLADTIRAKSCKDETDVKGRSGLHDSTYFRSLGEEVFRFFEAMMLEWLVETGAFVGKLPDLSASAPLFEENRKLFTQERGFIPFLLDADEEVLLERLLTDYARHLELSQAAGEPVPIRGGYEQAARRLLSNPTSGIAPEDAPRQALLEQSRKDRSARMGAYRLFAEVTIDVADKTPEEIAAEILAQIRELSLAA